MLVLLSNYLHGLCDMNAEATFVDQRTARVHEVELCQISLAGMVSQYLCFLTAVPSSCKSWKVSMILHSVYFEAAHPS
jgi:hypothetical protein